MTAVPLNSSEISRIGRGPPAEPHDEFFPWISANLLSRAARILGWSFFFFALNVPTNKSENFAKTSHPPKKTLPKTSSRTAPLQNANFAQIGSSQTWLFQTWLFVIFTWKRSFALFCALLRSFALFCGLVRLRSFACFCVRPRFKTTAFGNCRPKLRSAEACC